MKRYAAALAALCVVFVLPTQAEARNVTEKAKAPKVSDTPARTLSAKEIQKTVMPTLPALRKCYKRHGLRYNKANGKLTFELLINRDGRVKKHKTVAPGVKGKRFGKCVDSVVGSWAFPKKRGFTRAAVPFMFLKTRARGAGPR